MNGGKAERAEESLRWGWKERLQRPLRMTFSLRLRVCVWRHVCVCVQLFWIKSAARGYEMDATGAQKVEAETASALTLSRHSHFLLRLHHQKWDRGEKRRRDHICENTLRNPPAPVSLSQYMMHVALSKKACECVGEGERESERELLPLYMQIKNVNRSIVFQCLTCSPLGKMPEAALSVHVPFSQNDDAGEKKKKAAFNVN